MAFLYSPVVIALYLLGVDGPEHAVVPLLICASLQRPRHSLRLFCGEYRSSLCGCRTLSAVKSLCLPTAAIYVEVVTLATDNAPVFFAAAIRFGVVGGGPLLL